MNKIQKIALGVSGAIGTAMAFAGSALAVYTPDAVDTALGTAVTNVQDRIINFLTDNALILVTLAILLPFVFYGVRAIRKAVGR
jgi:hypothetical protein